MKKEAVVVELSLSLSTLCVDGGARREWADPQSKQHAGKVLAPLR
jgi:hypothetical protein